MILNDIVVTERGQHWAVVTELFPYLDKNLAHVHYIDIMTGELKKCPDERCHGEHTCPIHGQNVETAKPMNERDMTYLSREGMLSPKLVRAALRARKAT